MVTGVTEAAVVRNPSASAEQLHQRSLSSSGSKRPRVSDGNAAASVMAQLKELGTRVNALFESESTVDSFRSVLHHVESILRDPTLGVHHAVVALRLYLSILQNLGSDVTSLEESLLLFSDICGWWCLPRSSLSLQRTSSSSGGNTTTTAFERFRGGIRLTLSLWIHHPANTSYSARRLLFERWATHRRESPDPYDDGCIDVNDCIASVLISTSLIDLLPSMSARIPVVEEIVVRTVTLLSHVVGKVTQCSDSAGDDQYLVVFRLCLHLLHVLVARHLLVDTAQQNTVLLCMFQATQTLVRAPQGLGSWLRELTIVFAAMHSCAADRSFVGIGTVSPAVMYTAGWNVVVEGILLESHRGNGPSEDALLAGGAVVDLIQLWFQQVSADTAKVDLCSRFEHAIRHLPCAPDATRDALLSLSQCAAACALLRRLCIVIPNAASCFYRRTVEGPSLSVGQLAFLCSVLSALPNLHSLCSTHGGGDFQVLCATAYADNPAAAVALIQSGSLLLYCCNLSVEHAQRQLFEACSVSGGDAALAAATKPPLLASLVVYGVFPAIFSNSVQLTKWLRSGDASIASVEEQLPSSPADAKQKTIFIFTTTLGEWARSLSTCSSGGGDFDVGDTLLPMLTLLALLARLHVSAPHVALLDAITSCVMIIYRPLATLLGDASFRFLDVKNALLRCLRDVTALSVALPDADALATFVCETAGAVISSPHSTEQSLNASEIKDLFRDSIAALARNAGASQDHKPVVWSWGSAACCTNKHVALIAGSFVPALERLPVKGHAAFVCRQALLDLFVHHFLGAACVVDAVSAESESARAPLNMTTTLGVEAAKVFHKFAAQTGASVDYLAARYPDIFIRCADDAVLSGVIHSFHRSHDGSTNEQFQCTVIRHSIDSYAACVRQQVQSRAGNFVGYTLPRVLEQCRAAVACSLVADALLLPFGSIDQSKALHIACAAVGKDAAFVVHLCDASAAHIVVSLLAKAAQRFTAHRNRRWHFDSADVCAAATAFADAARLLCALSSRSDVTPQLIKAVESSTPLPAAMLSESTTARGGAEHVRSRLSRYLFDVLHHILKRVHFEDDAGYGAGLAPKCVPTTALWLAALGVFVRFLGPISTRIFQKLPALLQFCAEHTTLIPCVIGVWTELVSQLPEDVLASHCSTIAAELIALEHRLLAVVPECSVSQSHRVELSEQEKQSAFKNLENSFTSLHCSTSSAPIWSACVSVLTESKLVAVVAASRQSKSRLSLTSRSTLPSAEHIKQLLHGYSSCLTGSMSTTCKLLFTQGFHRFLLSADMESLLLCTEQCARSAVGTAIVTELVHCCANLSTDTTWNRQGSGSAVEQLAFLAAECLGLLGAVPVLDSSIDGASDSSDGATGSQAAVFCKSHMFDWRDLMFTLLSVFCVRALGTTSDATMHDRAALTIQSLLRCGVTRERNERGGLMLQDSDRIFVDELDRYTWWIPLKALTKEMFAPFTWTKYTPVVKVLREPKTPEFTGSSMSCLEWCFAWFCNLVHKAQGSFIGTVGLAARNTAKKDPAMLLYLLQHLTLALLTSASQAVVKDIQTEVAVVLASGCTEHNRVLIKILGAVEEVMLFCRRVQRKTERPPPGLTVSEATAYVERLEAFLSAEGVAVGQRAIGAIAADSYANALRTLESTRLLLRPHHLEGVGMTLNNLQKLLCELGDREGSVCVSKIRSSRQAAATCDDPESYELDNRWDKAKQAAERRLQHNPYSLPDQLCVLRCLRRMGELHLLSRYAVNCLEQQQQQVAVAAQQPTCKGADGGGSAIRELAAIASEAAWRLSEWDHVVVKQEPTRLQEVSLGPAVKALVQMRANGSCSTIADELDRVSPISGQAFACVSRECHQVRRLIVPAIAANSRDGLSRVAALRGTLHALADIEIAGRLVLSKAPTDADISALHKTLRRRVELAAPQSNDVEETLSAMHRVLFKSTGHFHIVASLWVQQGRQKRKTGHLDAALQALQHAVDDGGYTETDYFVEAAKLWYALDKSRALAFVGDLSVRQDEITSNMSNDVRHRLSLYGIKWAEEMGSLSPSEVISKYELVIASNASSAKAHLQLAQFHDKLFSSTAEGAGGSGVVEPVRNFGIAASSSTANQSSRTLFASAEAHAVAAIRHYCVSLSLGTASAYMTLPRLMTLWLETTAGLSLATTDPQLKTKCEALIQQMNSIMEHHFAPAASSRQGRDANSPVAPSVVFAVVPQLLSRVGHQHSGVVSVISRIVLRVMDEYPEQVLWLVMPVARTKQPRRCAVAKNDIIGAFQKRGKAEAKVVDNANAIFGVLLDICNAQADLFSDPKTRLTQMPFARKVEKTISASNFILPISQNIFPDAVVDGAGKNASSNGAVFTAFEDHVDVMSSLQKPKRIAVRGADGNAYPFLCKAKDDPRKDIRMMELVNLMNRLFLQDDESRRRAFSLRRYVVAALGDDYAIIEWISNNAALRRVVDETYAIDNSGVRTQAVKQLLAKVEAKQLTRSDMFKKHILVDARPVFHLWFQDKFLSATKWYQARERFTRSCALWSAVGHIVGLGDRHGENILIDNLTGEAMHVDFACMFDKGETLAEPERVRFRLTQNVVDGMGILGTDGAFRSTFEIALRTQMKHKLALMSVLETLLHDPLIEWGEKSKMDPKTLFPRVRRRLEGYLDLNARQKEVDAVACSVEDQASKLIQHATSFENLSMMYIWWMSWI